MKLLETKDFNQFLRVSRICRARSSSYKESAFFRIYALDFYKFLKVLGKHARCEVGVLAGHLFLKDEMIVKIFSTGETHEINTPVRDETRIIKTLLRKKIDILFDLHTHPVEYSNLTVVKVKRPSLLGKRWLCRDLLPSREDMAAWDDTKKFLEGVPQTVSFFAGIIAGEDFIITKIN